MATSFDDGLSIIVDKTTSATYTYIHSALAANASRTDYVWLTQRIPNAGGYISFADGISDFSVPSSLMTVAQGLAATYES